MRPHISLNVRDVQASARFYQKVFGIAPQKQTEDYAKFDLHQPPLNFSMLRTGGDLSRVNHFGIEVESTDLVAEWERRLQQLGLLDKVEQAVDCCYAKQDKVWFTDPDGNKWEVFTVLEQLPVTQPRTDAACCPSTCCAE